MNSNHTTRGHKVTGKVDLPLNSFLLSCFNIIYVPFRENQAGEKLSFIKTGMINMSTLQKKTNGKAMRCQNFESDWMRVFISGTR